MSVTQTVEANEFSTVATASVLGKAGICCVSPAPFDGKWTGTYMGVSINGGPPNRIPINYSISSLYHPFMVNVGLFYYKPSKYQNMVHIQTKK